MSFSELPWSCEHANEVPVTCPCKEGCYCKTRSCKLLRSCNRHYDCDKAKTSCCHDDCCEDCFGC